MIDLEAFILIGGRSSRLGIDKAFVELGGETLVERTARNIRSAIAPSRISLVTSSPDQFSTPLLFGLGLAVVADLRPGFGAWSGLHTALAYARSEWAFVAACDLPFVAPDLIRLITDRATGDRAAVVVRQPDGRLQPLYALYRVNPSLSVVEEILAAHRRVPPLATIFERLATHIIEPGEYSGSPDADRFFLNINTPDDLRTASLE